jgi:DnaJ-class molecular chaperone
MAAELKTCQSCEGTGRLATGFYDRDGSVETFECPECGGIGRTPWGAEHRSAWLENVEIELRKVPGLDEKDIEVLTAMASAGLDYADALRKRRAALSPSSPGAQTHE